MAERERRGDTARKFWVSVTLAVVGLVFLVYGLLTPETWYAAIPGVLLVVVFGVFAAGARRAKAAIGPKGVSAEADFEGLRPPPEREGDHR